MTSEEKSNKADLEEERQVQFNTAKTFKEENEINYFSEASAKNGINAKEVFIEAAKLLFKEHLKYKERNFKKIQNENNKVPIPIKVTKNDKNNINNQQELKSSIGRYVG